MTVESNYMIAIATLSGWLKRIVPRTRDSSIRALSQFKVIAKNFDWSITLLFDLKTALPTSNDSST